MRAILCLLLAAGLASGQFAAPGAAKPDKQTDLEDEALQAALTESNGSPIDIIHALELHLKKYPSSPRRREIDRTLTKAAIDLRDDRRIIEYGERALAADPEDLQLLDRVASALLQTQTTNPEKAARALIYARKFEELVLVVEKDKVERREAARHKEDVDRGLSRAFLFQARALGTLGKYGEAVAFAQKSFDRYASENAAHEMGRWLAKAGHEKESAEWFANALMIPDSRATESDRADDRKAMSEHWMKAKGSEAGLGDVILAAYDRTNALVAARNKRLKELDPNRSYLPSSPYHSPAVFAAGNKTDSMPEVHLWGPRGYTGESMIVMADRPERLAEIFTTFRKVAHVTHQYSMPYQHFDVYYCQGMKQPLSELWPRVKNWD